MWSWVLQRVTGGALLLFLLLHALNGVRIVLVDVSARALRRQGALLVVVLALRLALLVPISVAHLGNVFGGAS
ncbi:hypothetical protein [Kineococcus sp. SYSU DK004]|uniref:hypothetical protein n=1 Tax=Kineococcus sp. SYSU DK004 TaxID=3383125 RepID=UPI003D7CECA1